MRPMCNPKFTLVRALMEKRTIRELLETLLPY